MADLRGQELRDSYQNVVTRGTGNKLDNGNGVEFADLDDKASLLPIDITFQVGSGGDFATLNEAIEHLSRSRPIFGGVTSPVILNMVEGFVMSEQVFVHGIDLSWIRITGSDSETTIERSALTSSLFGRFPAFGVRHGGKTPIIAQLFSMDSTGDGTNRDGIFTSRGSTSVTFSNCGFKNVASRAFHCDQGSIQNNQGAIASGAGDRAFICNDGSTQNNRDTIGTNAGNRGYDCINGSHQNNAGADGSNAKNDSFRVLTGSTMNASVSTGSLSQSANTLTANGVIFK